VDKYNGRFSHNYVALPNANTKRTTRGKVDSVITTYQISREDSSNDYERDS
jgi:hypothetical protein